MPRAEKMMVLCISFPKQMRIDMQELVGVKGEVKSDKPFTSFGGCLRTAISIKLFNELDHLKEILKQKL